MQHLRYPKRSLVGDYLRALAGVGIAALVLLAVPPSTALVIIFGGLLLLFGIFGLRTLERQILEVSLAEEGLNVRGFRSKTLPWARISGFKLRFYGTRRARRGDGGGGFLQLTLKAPGTKVSFESSLEGFPDLVLAALRAARQNEIVPDETSMSNLVAMGLDLDEASDGSYEPLAAGC